MVAQPETHPRLTRVGDHLDESGATALSGASTPSNLAPLATSPHDARDDAELFNLSESPPKVESKHPLDKTTNIDPEAYDVIFDADKEDTDPKIPNYDPSKGEQRFAEYNSQAETNEE